jgi:hypothetical protein
MVPLVVGGYGCGGARAVGCALVFSADGTALATASDDRTARLWSGVASPDMQIEKICRAAGRNLTEEEWSRYLPDRPYEETCPH